MRTRIPGVIAALACASLIAACHSGPSVTGTAGAKAGGAVPTATATAATTATATGTAAATTGGSGGSATDKCPSASAVTAATGESMPAPTVDTGTFVTCNYNNESSGNNLVIVISPANAMTPALVQTAANSEASAQNTSASAVSGLGTAAFIFTIPGSAGGSTNNIATTNLSILAGSELIDLTGPMTQAHIEAVAHLVVN